MLEIYNGREKFYQWDVNQKLIVDDDIIAVQYDNGTGDALVCGVYELDGVKVADVPNIMLQTYWAIHAYAYCGECVRGDRVYEVEKRSRPDDYVYTETETLRYSTLYERVKTLEEQHIEEVGSVAAQIEETNSRITEQGNTIDGMIAEFGGIVETLFNSMEETENGVNDAIGRIEELEKRPTGSGGSSQITGRAEYISGKFSAVVDDYTGLELYAMGTDLLNYDVNILYANSKFHMVNMYEFEGTYDMLFVYTQAGALSYTTGTLKSDGTFRLSAMTNTNIPTIPDAYTQNGETHILVAKEHKYQLLPVDEVVGNSGSSSSNLVVIMAYGAEGQLIQDGQLTVEDIFNSVAEMTDIYNVKLMIMNAETQDIMCYSVAKIETSTVSIYFTNGIDTPIKMNTDGTLVYIA